MGRARHRGPCLPALPGFRVHPNIAQRVLSPGLEGPVFHLLSSASCRMAADSGRAWDTSPWSSKSLQFKLLLLVPGALGGGDGEALWVSERGSGSETAALF